MRGARTWTGLGCASLLGATLAACSIDTGGLLTRDSGEPRADGGADAGSRDAGDARPDGGAATDAGCGDEELCAAPADEDCDGVIDEGCPWYFGTPSPVVRVHRSTTYHFSPVLSTDGRRLYLHAPASSGTGLVVAQRASVEDRFAPPVEVPGSFGDVTLFSFTLNEGELELIAEVGGVASDTGARLYRSVRPARTEPFSALERLDALALAGSVREINPHLSRDGRELFYVSLVDGSHAIYRSTRPEPGMPFGMPMPVDLPGAGEEFTPFLTPDGLTLFFARGFQIWRASRADRDATAFTDGVVIAELGRAIFPFVSHATSEIFFVSDAAWSPAENAVWRARVCRDGPCVESAVDCPEGTTSEDRRHCYWQPGGGTETATFDDANADCVAGGGTLVTLHSEPEYEIVRSIAASGDPWIGAHDRNEECNITISGCVFEWVTGEPWLFAPWSIGQPNNLGGDENCTRSLSTGLTDVWCAATIRYVCERELWPW